MIHVVKILFILAIILLLDYPFITGKGKLAKLFPASGLRYYKPHNRKNFYFVLLIVAEFALFVILFGIFDKLVFSLGRVSFIGKFFTTILKAIDPKVNFVVFTIRIIVLNLIFIYGYLFLKIILKKLFLDPIFGFARKLKKKKKKKDDKGSKDSGQEDTDTSENSEDSEDTDTDSDDGDDGENHSKKRRIPKFLHFDVKDSDSGVEDTDSDEEDTDEKEKEGDKKKYFGPVASFFLGIFFEGDQFEYAKNWVMRVRVILKTFTTIVLIVYGIMFFTVLLAAFFPLPKVMYSFLIGTLKIANWYVYPMISVIFLRELCNTFDTDSPDPAPKEPEKPENKEKKGEKALDARLRKLLGELKKHFDAEHSLRYYPEAAREKIPDYVPGNRTYKSALNYIKEHMKKTSGRVVQSYMQCLDSSFNGDNVYFASSFYSELGEYLIAYAYIRLLSGSRMVFVVSDDDERATLRSFISERLMRLTGTGATYSWRIYTANERLDQADVLIASPSDFRYGNLVSQYPTFFEEVSNAVFIDCDRMISLDSYLCPVMATQLQRASGDRIRFLFLTQDLYKGFAARSLPKFFCTDEVLTFSSAKENESVSYVLWNRESKSHRIYNRNGQKTTCLECMIADMACHHNIDGVRVITENVLDHAERKILAGCGVEINKLYRDVVDVNYMIYSDERCNLAASIYACTRFRGRKRSVVHILSKPYLLREYFISKAATENFVNRASFIQPRVLEHADQHKLSLLRIFCDASSEKGMQLCDFESQMQKAISVCRERGSVIFSAFCKKLIEGRDVTDLKTGELAAYLIAGLCDTDIYESPEQEQACALSSLGHRAKEFYLIIDPSKQDGYCVHREKYIVFNRAKDVFDALFACNKRVELRLNDEVIGLLDTFPMRTHLEYIAGQSIRYKNAEYEIEHISDDGCVVYLRSENVKIRNCLDTVHLRRYEIDSLEAIKGRTGVLHNTRLNLQEIRVTECRAAFTAETYGFWGLTSDKQTLDFYHKDGMDGNPHVLEPHVRKISDGRVLRVELTSRMECTDEMRLLLAAVFNEFVRTIFPRAYHFISIVPMLEAPMPFGSELEPSCEIERIKTLYPYLVSPKEEFVETDKNRITFLFINDCHEDIGAFQWFYDLSGRYMQEFLANIYSYLRWLKLRPDFEHYIYFGKGSLPECFDLDGCCQLLEGYNLLFSNPGEDDIETAGEDTVKDVIERCAFCHKEMESGRYSLFDKARYICADCFEIVDDKETLASLLEKAFKYLTEKYPDKSFGSADAKFDGLYELAASQVLSEYYYRVDISDRCVYVERDEPTDNVTVSLIRGLIELWQADNECINAYSKGQLYYEELLFLRSRELDKSADWIYNALDNELRAIVDEISDFTGVSVAPVITDPVDDTDTDTDTDTDADTDTDTETETDTDTDSDNDTDNDTDGDKDEETDGDGDDNGDGDGSEKPEKTDGEKKLTSFDYIISKKTDDISKDDDDDLVIDDEDFDGLYDPNKTPRFWKRYLKGGKVDTGKEEHNEDTDDKDSDENGKKRAKKSKKQSKDKIFGEKFLPYEEEEATNPKIRAYNDVVRHCFSYSEGPIMAPSLNLDEFLKVVEYVNWDYPELFWLTTVCTGYNDGRYFLHFRCKDANDKLDIKQIDRKRAEIKRAAKDFTRGITRRTDPYEALKTLYRRLILNVDYDSIGLNSGAGKDKREDDTLRSLHGALVNRKCVCAGYAVAMQYLLQSVGVVCGYVISSMDSNGKCHAFNILKLGKFCYYLDATWGDASNTKDKSDETHNWVQYDYFCVPYDEFLRTEPSVRHDHIPEPKYYPNLETFKYTNHEYYRFHSYYMNSYNEGKFVDIIEKSAKDYDPKEMGDFVVAVRFASQATAKTALSIILANGTLAKLVDKAKSRLSKKAHKELLDRERIPYSVGESGILSIRFKTPEKSRKKKNR